MTLPEPYRSANVTLNTHLPSEAAHGWSVMEAKLNELFCPNSAGWKSEFGWQQSWIQGRAQRADRASKSFGKQDWEEGSNCILEAAEGTEHPFLRHQGMPVLAPCRDSPAWPPCKSSFIPHARAAGPCSHRHRESPRDWGTTPDLCLQPAHQSHIPTFLHTPY